MIVSRKYVESLEAEVKRLQAREAALLKTVFAQHGLADNFGEAVTVKIEPFVQRRSWAHTKRTIEKMLRAG